MFDKLFDEVIDYLKPQKRFDGIKIDFQPCKQQIPFKADSTHIQQLLYNLFNNAADAMTEKDIKEITITTSIIKDENLFKVYPKEVKRGKTDHYFGFYRISFIKISQIIGERI